MGKLPGVKIRRDNEGEIGISVKGKSVKRSYDVSVCCWTSRLTGMERDHCAGVTVGHYVCYFLGIGDNPIVVYVFNTVALRWFKLPPMTTEVPSMRYGLTAVLIIDDIYVWGGKSTRGEYCNELYAFNVDTHRWFKPRVSGTVPLGRCFHSACVLGKVMYIYGGDTQLTRLTNDIYKLETATMVWSLINTRGTPPAAAEGHSATIIGTKMYVLWDVGSKAACNIRAFDTETDCWLSMPSAQLPTDCWKHSSFAYKGEMCVFGGGKRTRHFNCLWRFNPETFSWRKAEPWGKAPLKMYGPCCCVVADRVVLFGGYEEYTLTDDLFILDLLPSLKTLCKVGVIHYGLDEPVLGHYLGEEYTLTEDRYFLRPSLKELCKVGVIRYGLDKNVVRCDIRRELSAMEKYRIRHF